MLLVRVIVVSSFLGLPPCVGYYLLVVVRGCPIVPCFEHVRAGGGGVVV